MENKEDNKDRDKSKPTFINYSGLGLQTVLIIGLGAYLGSLLDDKYQLDKNWFTLGLILLSVGLSMAYTIRTLNKWNN